MKKVFKNILVIQVNGTPMLEYDREKKLSATQSKSLALIEEKLGQGFQLGNTFINKPKLEQRVEFVTANLISAILNDNDVTAAASCAYIAHALPDLKQIKAIANDEEVSIELVFDQEYQLENKLSFTPINQTISRPR